MYRRFIQKLHCWDAVTDSYGKMILPDGYETFKIGETNPDCEVPVKTTETIPNSASINSQP